MPRNKRNSRRRKKVSLKDFIVADLRTSWSHVGIGGLGKRYKNMNVCVIMYFILNCFFFFLRNFSFIFASELGGLLYLYLKLLCFLCIFNRIEENINYLEWGKKKAINLLLSWEWTLILHLSLLRCSYV